MLLTLTRSKKKKIIGTVMGPMTMKKNSLWKKEIDSSHSIQMHILPPYPLNLIVRIMIIFKNTTLTMENHNNGTMLYLHSITTLKTSLRRKILTNYQNDDLGTTL